MTEDELEAGNTFFDRVTQASGLASIIASVAVARACIRADVDPKMLTAESLARVLPHLQQTLQHYHPIDAERHVAAIRALTSEEGAPQAGGPTASPPETGESGASPAQRRSRAPTLRIEATLLPDDVEQIVRQFVPLEVALGKDGTSSAAIAVEEVTAISLVPGTGVRVLCSARIRWPILGIRLPVIVQRLGILLLPSIRSADGEERLVLQLRLESADIAWVPSRVDQSITEHVNRELADHRVELVWNFQHALTRVFPLPPGLRTAASLQLRVEGGRVEVTEGGLRLSVSLAASVAPRPTLAVHA